MPRDEPKGKMNAITLRSDRKLKKLKALQIEEDEGLARDLGKEMVEEKENSSLESEEENKHEKAKKPKPVKPHRPLIPSLKSLLRLNLRLNLGSSWRY